MQTPLLLVTRLAFNFVGCFWQLRYDGWMWNCVVVGRNISLPASANGAQ